MTQTAISRNEATSTAIKTRRHLWSLGIGQVLLGLGAAVVALLGPLVAGVIEYHASEGAVNQVVGGDVAGLLLVAPVSILAGILTLRGHTAGPVIALGPALYALYTYAQLALGGDVVRYPGNSEQFFGLYLGLFVLAGLITVSTWSYIDPTRLPGTSRRTDRVLGVFLLVVAAFLVVGLHLPGLMDVWSGQPTSPEYLADPNVFWLVKLMDLGIVVPAMVAIGTGVLRGAGWAHRAKYAAVGWVALLGSSVAGMAMVMQATNDPSSSAAITAVFTLFAAAALGIASVVYRTLFRGTPGSPQ